jgi:hypothetical protein
MSDEVKRVQELLPANMYKTDLLELKKKIAK